MAMIRWNPWNINRLLEDDWDLPTIPGLSRLAGQGINIYETDEAVIAELALPGVTEDNIDVTIDDDGIVRVTGVGEQNQEERAKRRYYMSSMSNSFNYTFRLPQGIVSDQEPSADFENGVLMLSFLKVQKKAPQKIKVRGKTKGSKELQSK